MELRLGQILRHRLATLCAGNHFWRRNIFVVVVSTFFIAQTLLLLQTNSSLGRFDNKMNKFKIDSAEICIHRIVFLQFLPKWQNCRFENGEYALLPARGDEIRVVNIRVTLVPF